jgi:hypothetical protein
MGEMRNVCRILGRKPKWERTLGSAGGRIKQWVECEGLG